MDRRKFPGGAWLLRAASDAAGNAFVAPHGAGPVKGPVA